MRKTVICAMAVMLVACGGGGTGTTAQPNTQSRPIRGSADIITEAEINAGVYQNALEVVQSLRPAMMRPRQGGANAQAIMLYLDGVRMSELNGMSTIPAERVREIRFINARDATTRWGTGHDSGVILVTTKR
jgi:hypothetical protein